MGTLYVDALFTNISSDETIDICIKKLFSNPETLMKGISKNDFRDLLNLATKESLFTFDNKFYIQVDHIAMGSPLDPVLVNIENHEENWLNRCPIKLKPSFLGGLLMMCLYFLNHLNHFADIRPLITRTQTSPSFLDVNICRKNEPES